MTIINVTTEKNSIDLSTKKQTVIEVAPKSNSIVASVSSAGAINVATENHIIEVSNKAKTIIEVNPVTKNTIHVTAAGLQGEKGDKGDTGEYAMLHLPLPQSIPSIDAHTVIAAGSTGMVVADVDDATLYGKIIGLVKNAAVAGATLDIGVSGSLIENFQNLTIGDKYYLTHLGQITTTVPTSGLIQLIGTALSATQMYITISTPVIKI
jgi:hypothetical protein